MNKINNPRKIAILMATYNGAKYIEEQIESIVNQSEQDWTLYIQDDGSTDGTVDIINRYADGDKIVFVDRGLSKQGAGMNFMSLLNMVESPYYMFADQDDVWFPDKVEKSLARIQEEEQKHPDLPVIVHTSRTFTDANLNVTMPNEFNPRKLPLERIERKINNLKRLDILRIYTIAGGCTMLLNHKVKEVSIPFCNVRVHDSVCAMATAKHGGIISTIIEPTMYYRLHGGNTCGVSSSSLLTKFSHIFRVISANLKGYPIWKIYGGGNFLKFLYWRIRYFLILRLN